MPKIVPFDWINKQPEDDICIGALRRMGVSGANNIPVAPVLHLVVSS